MYTVRLQGWLYVLHCFQKKSTKGIETPKADIELLKSRMKLAEADHATWLKQSKGAVK
ncbi:MAG: type II toxin-antitoxin system RelE/ParE family toxin [Acidovorax sp.]